MQFRGKKGKEEGKDSDEDIPNWRKKGTDDESDSDESQQRKPKSKMSGLDAGKGNFPKTITMKPQNNEPFSNI